MRNSMLHMFTFILFCFAALSCGCNEFGQKIVVDGTEVFFDGEKITQADAENLSQFLKSTGFADGGEKSVQLKRDGEKLIFRMVVQPEYLASTEMDRDFKVMCLELSSAFEGQEVECHGCDERFNLKKKFNGLRGQLVEFGKSELYYNSVSTEQLDKVKAVLEKLGFLEFEGTLYFGKGDGAFEFRMSCNEEFYGDEEIQRETKIWQVEFSKAVDGQKVAVLLCDEYLEAKFTREAMAVDAAQTVDQ